MSLKYVIKKVNLEQNYFHFWLFLLRSHGEVNKFMVTGGNFNPVSFEVSGTMPQATLGGYSGLNRLNRNISGCLAKLFRRVRVIKSWKALKAIGTFADISEKTS